MNVLDYLFWYLILLAIIFLIVYFVTFVIFRKKLKENKGYKYIIKKYDLHVRGKKSLLLSNLLVFINSIILSVPIYIISLVSMNYFVSLGISLVIFIVLIIGLYNLLGFILKKKGW